MPFQKAIGQRIGQCGGAVLPIDMGFLAGWYKQAEEYFQEYAAETV